MAMVEIYGYVLSYVVPYEGVHSEEFETLDEVREWVLNNPSRYDFDWDNLTLTPRVQTLDLFKIMGIN